MRLWICIACGAMAMAYARYELTASQRCGVSAEVVYWCTKNDRADTWTCVLNGPEGLP